MPRERYRTDGKNVFIDVRVKDAKQLFDYRDPSPFRDRDLDDEFEEYVISSAEEFSSRTDFRLAIHVSDAPDPKLDTEAIRSAVRSHFEYKAELQRKHFTRLIRTAEVSLLIGFAALFICLGLARLTERNGWADAFPFVREGLVILGWVAMWRPIDMMLYEWWPLRRRILLYRKLAATPMEIFFKKPVSVRDAV